MQRGSYRYGTCYGYGRSKDARADDVDAAYGLGHSRNVSGCVGPQLTGRLHILELSSSLGLRCHASPRQEENTYRHQCAGGKARWCLLETTAARRARDCLRFGLVRMDRRKRPQATLAYSSARPGTAFLTRAGQFRAIQGEPRRSWVCAGNCGFAGRAGLQFSAAMPLQRQRKVLRMPHTEQ